MRDVREIYPTADDGNWFEPRGGYQPLLEGFGWTIIAQADEDSYQGDSLVLYRDGDRYGYLQFGWGSCSGCDSLCAAHSYADIEELQRELHDSIKWFDSRTEALGWVDAHDWEGDHLDQGLVAEFTRSAKLALAASHSSR